MAGQIVVREARKKELAAVEALIKSVYAEFQPLFPDERWQLWMENIARTVHAPEGVVLVAECDGRMAGAIKFYPDASQSALGSWPFGASMRVLAVDPGFQGHGIGTRLIEECIRRARALRITTIFLYTGDFMHAARHIYEKLGFQRAFEFDRSPGPIAYRLDLEG